MTNYPVFKDQERPESTGQITADPFGGADAVVMFQPDLQGRSRDGSPDGDERVRIAMSYAINRDQDPGIGILAHELRHVGARSRMARGQTAMTSRSKQMRGVSASTRDALGIALAAEPEIQIVVWLARRGRSWGIANRWAERDSRQPIPGSGPIDGVRHRMAKLFRRHQATHLGSAL